MNSPAHVGTKIVATLGPATATTQGVEALLRAGADVVRINFSHGSQAEHERALGTVREAAQRVGKPVAVIGDLCGPKVRLCEIEGGSVDIAEGQSLRLVGDNCLGTAQRIAVSLPQVLDDVALGHRVLIDDGNVRLRVTGTDAEGLTCICEVGGPVGSKKGMNLPDSDLGLPTLTEKDIVDARWAAKSGVDYVALSFVRQADDVTQLRELLADLDSQPQIIAKIETPQAVRQLDDIIRASDAVLVARGDLGVELDVATVPRLQKEMTRKCLRAGKPVIVATQMLQSMVNSPVPTRAEVSDIANAIYDGADALMLSAETAIGRYPVQAVQMLRRVALETEAYDAEDGAPVDRDPTDKRAAAAVARGLCRVAADIQAKAVVVWAETGRLARLVSKHRLDIPVAALAPTETVQRRLCLYYGVRPFLAERASSADALILQADRIATAAGWAKPGHRIVIGFGPQSISGAHTGSIIVHTVQGD